MMTSLIRSAFIIAALTSLAAETHAQQPRDTSASVTVRADTVKRASFGTLLPAAIVGSALGIVSGVSLGIKSGWGGGDDPGLTGALVFGVLGSTAGTAVGIRLAGRGTISRGAAWSAGVVGVLGGVGGAIAAAKISSTETSVAVGFALGQGIVSAAIASGIMEHE